MNQMEWECPKCHKVFVIEYGENDPPNLEHKCTGEQPKKAKKDDGGK